MTNKEYRNAREMHENAEELFTYEKYNGWYVSRALDANDLRELRAEYKVDKQRGAFTLDGFNNRAVVIPTNGGYVLKSYDTIVCAMHYGTFYKVWRGYSATTIKHINAFRKMCHMDTLFTKRGWIELDNNAVWSDGDLIDAATGEVIYIG